LSTNMAISETRKVLHTKRQYIFEKRDD